MRVARIGNPILKQVAKPFTHAEILKPETKDLVNKMFNKMAEEDGVGLAAPQVCVSKQLIVVHVPTDMWSTTPLKLALFNPKVKVNGTKTFQNWESCISVPEYVGLVDRHDDIEVEFLDDQAQPRKIKTRGLYSGLFQHEIDHLNGMLYLWRISSTGLQDKLFHMEEASPDNTNFPRVKEPKTLFTLD